MFRATPKLRAELLQVATVQTISRGMENERDEGRKRLRELALENEHCRREALQARQQLHDLEQRVRHAEARPRVVRFGPRECVLASCCGSSSGVLVFSGQYGRAINKDPLSYEFSGCAFLRVAQDFLVRSEASSRNT